MPLQVFRLEAIVYDLFRHGIADTHFVRGNHACPLNLLLEDLEIAYMDKLRRFNLGKYK